MGIQIKLCGRKFYVQKNQVLLCGLVFALTFLAISNYCGSIERLFEEDFEFFKYPLEVDLKEQINLLKSGQRATVGPIENYDRFRNLMGDPRICRSPKTNLLLVVKSSVEKLTARNIIRRTWANGSQFLVAGKTWRVRHFFVVGRSLQPSVDYWLHVEQSRYGDLVQYDFLDSYFNNTIKTICEFRWISEHCAKIPYILFLDDDYFVNVPNAINFFVGFSPSEHLYAGNRMFVEPIRGRGSNVWRISLDEYPYSMYPPYINGGAFAMTNRSVIDFWLASRFVKFLRFDDVYIGIISWKLGINPRQVDSFKYKYPQFDLKTMRSVIASHGFKDPGLMHDIHTAIFPPRQAAR